MATARVDVVLGVQADVKAARQQIETLVTQLDKIRKMPIAEGSGAIDIKNLQQAQNAASELKIRLNDAFNVNTGKLDLNVLNKGLVQSGVTLQDYKRQLMAIGPEGQQAFLKLSSAIATAETPLVAANSKLQQFGKTLMNTVKWQISSSLLHGLVGGISSAVNYAKNLNESLNNIRIVTGQSTDQMARLAAQANKTAQALSTSTLDYTNAALIYYQQGLNDEAVQERTETTLKLANVTGKSASEISSYMTAIWNNFDNGTKSLEFYADAITALGASTASSSEEIATGLGKFAAVAETVGLSYEYATAALATVVAETRQSADTVGTAFRTLFSRLESLSLGETLDDDTTLNKYSQALATVGVNIKDSNGQLKEMDQILDELGSRWGMISKEQQVALAQTVGGVRQYTNLIALMDNWDEVKENVQIAENSEGTLQQQQDIFAEGWEGASSRLKAAFEDIYAILLDDNALADLTDFFAKLTSGIGGFIKEAGGLKFVLMAIPTLLMQAFPDWLPNRINSAAMGIKNLVSGGPRNGEALREQAFNEATSMYDTGTASGAMQAEITSKLTTAQIEYNQKASMMNDIQKKISQEMLRQVEKKGEQATKAAEDLATEEHKLEVLKNQAKVDIRSNKDASKNSDGEQAKALGRMISVGAKSPGTNLDKDAENAQKEFGAIIARNFAKNNIIETNQTDTLLEDAEKAGSMKREFKKAKDESRLTSEQGGKIVQDIGVEQFELYSEKMKQLAMAQGTFQGSIDDSLTSMTSMRDAIGDLFPSEGETFKIDTSQLNNLPKQMNEIKTSVTKTADNIDKKLEIMGDDFDKVYGPGMAAKLKEHSTKLREVGIASDNVTVKEKALAEAQKKYGEDSEQAELAQTNLNNSLEIYRQKQEEAIASGEGLDTFFSDLKLILDQVGQALVRAGIVPQETINQIQKQFDTIIQKANDARLAEERVGDVKIPDLTKTQLISQGLGNVASMAMSANMALNSLKSAITTFSDDDASTFDKITSAIMAFGMGLNFATNLQKGLTSAVENFSKAKQASDTKDAAVDAVRQGRNKVTALSEAAANWWTAGIILALLALAGLSAASSIADKQAEKKREQQKEQIKQTQELADAANEAADANKELETSYMDLYAEMQRTGEVTEELEDAAKAVAEAYGIEGAAVAILKGDYEALTAAIIEARNAELEEQSRKNKIAAQNTATEYGMAMEEAAEDDDNKTYKNGVYTSQMFYGETAGETEDAAVGEAWAQRGKDFYKYLSWDDETGITMTVNTDNPEEVAAAYEEINTLIEDYQKLAEERELNTSEAEIYRSLLSEASAMGEYADQIQGYLDVTKNNDIEMSINKRANENEIDLSGGNFEAGQYAKYRKQVLIDAGVLDETGNQIIDQDKYNQVSKQLSGMNAQFAEYEQAYNALRELWGKDEADTYIERFLGLGENAHEYFIKFGIHQDSLEAALTEAETWGQNYAQGHPINLTLTTTKTLSDLIEEGWDENADEIEQQYQELIEHVKAYDGDIIDFDEFKQLTKSGQLNYIQQKQEEAESKAPEAYENDLVNALNKKEPGQENTEKEIQKKQQQAASIQLAAEGTRQMVFGNIENYSSAMGIFSESDQEKYTNQIKEGQYQEAVDNLRTDLRLQNFFSDNPRGAGWDLKDMNQQDLDNIREWFNQSSNGLTDQSLEEYVAENGGWKETDSNKILRYQDLSNSTADVNSWLNNDNLLTEEQKDFLNNAEKFNSDNFSQTFTKEYLESVGISDNELRKAGVSEELIGGDSVELTAEQLDALSKQIGEQIDELKDQYNQYNTDVEEAKAAFEKYQTDQLQADIDRLGISDEDLQETTEAVKELNGMTGASQKQIEQTAIAILKFNKGLENLNSDLEEYGDILKNDAKKGTVEYNKALNAVRQDMADILNISEDSLSEEFFSPENFELMEEAAQGDVDAIEQLRIKASDDIIQNIIVNNPELTPEAVNKIQSLHDELQSYASDNGFTFSTTINDEQFKQKCNEIIATSGMTAQQAGDYFKAMGYNAEIIYKEDTQVSKKIHQKGQLWNPEIYDYEDIDSLMVETTTTRIPVVKAITYTGSAGGNISSTNASRGSSGGGGGGGSSKEKKKSSDEIERYHVVDNLLQSVKRDLDRIADAKDDVWGAARLDAIDQETAALERQLEVYDQYEQEILDYLAQDKANIAQYGAEFDEYGNITNYDEIMQQQLDKYNNSLTDEAEQEYEAFKEYLKQYEETLEKYYDNQEERMETIRKLVESKLEKITTTVELKIEIDDLELENIERLLGRIEDRAFRAAEAIGLMADKADPLLDKIAETQKGIDDIYKLAEENLSNGWFTETGGFSADMKDQLDTYKEDLADLDEEISSLISDIFDTAEEAISEANEKLDLQIGRFDSYSTIFDNYVTMLGLLGKTTANAQTIITLGNQKVENSINKLSALQAKQAVNEANLAAAQQAYLDAVASGNEEMIERASKDVEQLTADVEQGAVDVQSALSEVLQAAADNFSNTANQIADVASKAMAGMYASLDQMSNWYENAKTKQDVYVSETERLYQLNKLNRDILKSIDETDNVATKTKLRDLQKQINQLLAQGNKMTQYDLDKLQAQYEVRQAQIALEEAQNAKNQVRLVRNAEGGFGYVYTADQDSIDSAQQNYEDKLYNLQKLAEDQVKELSDKIVENEQAMIEALRNLRAEDFASEVEYQAELNRIMEYYTGLDLDYRQLLDSVIVDSGITWNDTLLSQYENTQSWSEGHSNMVNAAIEAIDGLTSAYGDWHEYTQNALEAAGVDAENYAKQFAKSADEVSAKSKEVAEDVKEAAEDLTEYVEEAWSSAGQFFKDYGTALQDIRNEIDSTIQKLNDLITAFNNAANAAYDYSATVSDVSNPTPQGPDTKGKDDGDGSGPGYTPPPTYSKNYIDIPIQGEGLTDPWFLNATFYKVPGTLLYAKKSDIQKYGKPLDTAGTNHAIYRVEQNGKLNLYERDPASGQLHFSKKSSYDTGGYTGEFGPEGKLAVLHEKELVLNKNDTENFLNIVQILRDLQLQSSIISRLPRFAKNVDKKEGIQQNVTIYADFPDATDRDEIAAALLQLASQSSQYILQSGR